MVGLAAVAVFGTVVVSVFVDDPQRQYLDRQIRNLEAQIVAKRAIAENLEAYLERVRELRSALLAIDRKLGFNPQRLRDTLGDDVEFTILDEDRSRMCLVRRFQIRGTTRPALKRSLEQLEASGHYLARPALELSPRGWTLTAVGYHFEDRAPPGTAAANLALAPPPAGEPLMEPWYAPRHDDHRVRGRGRARRGRPGIGQGKLRFPPPKVLRTPRLRGSPRQDDCDAPGPDHTVTVIRPS